MSETNQSATSSQEAKSSESSSQENSKGSQENQENSQSSQENQENSKSSQEASENQNHYNYFAERVQALKEIDKYPHKFEITIDIPTYIAKYSYLTNDQTLMEDKQSIVGRIVTLRWASKKLCFFHVNHNGQKIQVMINARAYNENAKISMNNLSKVINRSDIVGIQGFPTRTKTGELSLLAYEIVLLAPCLHDVPLVLTDKATRYRNRHLDLLVNPDNKQIFIVRNRIIQYIRNFLNNLDFVEIDTPMMHPIAGGASAKPFVTHHNCLDMDLFMRIAPELYLKKAIVGGFDKVFEIGKQFRNESIDLTHNPEFTTCEFYWSYADYYDLMGVTEQLISGMVESIYPFPSNVPSNAPSNASLSHNQKATSEGTTSGSSSTSSSEGQNASLEVEATSTNKLIIEYNGKKIDFTLPYRRVSMIDELERLMEIKFPDCSYESDEMLNFLLDQCKKHHVTIPDGVKTISRILDKLVGAFIEPTCVNPTFICDHPLIMSPLAKTHRNNPRLTERFELFIDGLEYCNSYTELNDPFDQRQRFMKQVEDKNDGDDEAQDLDEDFINVLEYGLPPTGGWGCGIERLTMLLTNTPNIKEVILFPAMKQ